MIGQVIDARYKILRQLGSGGMGAVFEAEHVGTGRRCAIKVILPDKAARKEALARFLREARTMGRVESEHVVQVTDTGQDPATGVAFMAMELLVGEDLCQLFERNGALNRDVVLRIAAEALEGLCAAHEAGVVHRDLKPANLFLARGKGNRRLVKILDFGIAKVLSSDDAAPEPNLTRTGGILGSPSYMSPEQAGGLKTIDHRTDIWSLGAVLYHLLSGLPPYADAETLKEVIVRICKSPPPPLREVAPPVALDISDLVEHAMRHDPAERFQSAQAMLEEVKRLLAGPATLTAEIVGEAISAEAASEAASAPSAAEPAVEVAANARAATHAGLANTVDKRRSRRAVAFVIMAAVSLAIGVVAAIVLPSRLAKPQADQHDGAATASVHDIAPSAPVQHAVRLRVEPADVSVEVDGAPARIEAGAVELQGAAGTKHKVRLLNGARATEVEVTVTAQGPSPDVVRLDATQTIASALASPAAASAMPAAASASPQARPGKTAQPTAPPAKGKSDDPFGGVAQ